MSSVLEWMMNGQTMRNVARGLLKLRSGQTEKTFSPIGVEMLLDENERVDFKNQPQNEKTGSQAKTD